MLYLDVIQCLGRTCNRFGEPEVNNSARPEGQPRHIVDSDTNMVEVHFIMNGLQAVAGADIHHPDTIF